MANPANTTAYRLSDGRIAVNVTENKTLTVDDCGYVQNVIVDGVVVTLPATASLGTWTVRNGGAAPAGAAPGTASDGTVGLYVSPNASDKIQGGVPGTATDNKDLINVKTTSRIGDEVGILNVGETNGPLVSAIKGKWTREA